ncbi:MAG TPA: glycoside hydrolase domain-containing protein [Pyrinomonadaceae bacterium]|jgi:hypothetical protein
MSLFLGFDRSQYPGDALMQTLRAQAGLAWTGFYLAPAPSHADAGWMQKRALLQGFGYGFAPVYLGQQQGGPGSHNLSAAQGTRDGQNAARLAAQAGFPTQTVIYLDIETGPPIEPVFLDYYAAWTQSVLDENYAPGVYCSHLLAAQLRARDARPVFWVFRLLYPVGGTFAPPLPLPAPAQAGFSDATLLQFAQSVALSLPDGTKLSPVDLDSSTVADPSRRTVAAAGDDAPAASVEPAVQPS